MKTITVAFWFSSIKEVPYDHHESFEYSVEKREEIIDTLLGLGVNMLLRKSDDTLFIYMSRGSFGQR